MVKSRNPANISRLCSVAVVVCLFGLTNLSRAAEEEPNPNPPYLFTLFELTQQEIDTIKNLPCVRVLSSTNGGFKFSWQPWNAETWESGKRHPNDGYKRLFPFLSTSKDIGRHVFERSVSSSERAGTIVRRAGANQFCCGVFYSDIYIALLCFSEALPEQVAHEMLRDVPGTEIRIEKCGPGFVIVSKGQRGEMTLWQVSDQSFVRIDNSFDPAVVAAYAHRWGSITPKDIDTSLDKWVLNEIRWRLQLMRLRIQRRQEAKINVSLMELEQSYVAQYFLTYVSAAKAAGVWLVRDSTLEQEWAALKYAREWLWVNRKNFKYDDRERSYVLKGADLFDPAHPPELPEELRFVSPLEDKK